MGLRVGELLAVVPLHDWMTQAWDEKRDEQAACWAPLQTPTWWNVEATVKQPMVSESEGREEYNVKVAQDCRSFGKLHVVGGIRKEPRAGGRSVVVVEGRLSMFNESRMKSSGNGSSLNEYVAGVSQAQPLQSYPWLFSRRDLGKPAGGDAVRDKNGRIS